MSEITTICSGASADGNYPSASGVSLPKQDMVFLIYGTFGSGTVTFQVSLDGTNFIAVTNGAFTAAGTMRLQVGSAGIVRVVISGSSGASITVKGS